jgi:hypothetical protein
MSNNITIRSPAKLPFSPSRGPGRTAGRRPGSSTRGLICKRKLAAHIPIDDLIDPLWAKEFHALSGAEQEVISTLVQDYNARQPPYTKLPYGPR